MFTAYRRPDTDPLPLSMPPRLESWEKKGHPSQLALSAFLEHVEQVLDGQMPSGNDLSFELSVAFTDASRLLVGGDLDNYLFPVVRRFGHARFLSAWATKKVGSTSSVRIARAEPANPIDLEGLDLISALSSESATTTRWKEELSTRFASQIARPLADGPIELQICFRVGSHRNWANLWKPAIDSLGPLIGEGPRKFHPNDDRIVSLGLHKQVDDTIGHAVHVSVWYRAGDVERLAR